MATNAYIIIEVNNTRSYKMTISDKTYEALNDVIVIYIKELNTSLKLITARLNDIEQKIDDVDANVCNLELSEKMKRVNTHLATIQSTVSRGFGDVSFSDIEEKIDDIDTNISNLDIPCIDGLENDLSRIQDAISDIPTEGCGCNS